MLTGGGFDQASGSATYNAVVLPASVPAIETAEFVRTGRGTRFVVEASYARPRKFMGLSLEVTGTRGYLRLDMSADPLLTDYHALTCATFAGNRFGPAQAQALLREQRIRCKGWEELEGSERGSFFRAVFGYDDSESWSGDLRAFVQAVRDGRPERSRDGLEALALIGAARRSAKAGGVPVPRGSADVAYVVG
jgi:predicted dehydrogenase